MLYFRLRQARKHGRYCSRYAPVMTNDWEVWVAKDRGGYGWDRPTVRAALSLAEQSGPAVAALARKICAIPAPTFHEAERAAFVAEQFRARGLAPLGDPAGNVTSAASGHPARWDAPSSRPTPIPSSRSALI